MLTDNEKKTCLVFPGQGSQFKGMGKELFQKYPELVELSDSILNYSIADLCLNDSGGNLSYTKYTQPALYVVNTMYYLDYIKSGANETNYLLGHSLGEYNALVAAGVMDFKTGLEIVKRRAELFAEIKDGGMMAVMGGNQNHLEEIIKTRFPQLDFANYNSDEQTILSGNQDQLRQAEPFLTAAGMKTILLNVSGAFHSRYMEPAREKFKSFVLNYSFNDPVIPVYSNYNCIAYTKQNTADLLTKQISNPVSWKQQVKMVLNKGTEQFKEVGPGVVLTRLIQKIKETNYPVTNTPKSTPSTQFKIGSESFRNRYKIQEAYVAGAMYRGISSSKMVIKMANSDLLSFLGCGGMSLEQIKSSIEDIQSNISPQKPFGINFLHNPINPQWELDLSKLCISKNIKVIEASAFATASTALVYYRLKGAKFENGKAFANHYIIAKISRPEVAEVFLSPPPENIINELLTKGYLTSEEAEAGKYISLASDITTEADSGGHTDQGVAFTLIPVISLLRNRFIQKFGYNQKIHIGAAGGIGTPQAIVASIMLGADYVLTGSINQCTVEAGTSDIVKDMISKMNIQDTDYAPAGDMFEIGAQVQVLKKGVLFPVRGKKLYELYKQYNSLEELPKETSKMIQEKYFGKSFEKVWKEVENYFKSARPETLAKMQSNPKLKMANIFKYYFVLSTQHALNGDLSHKVDFQIQCGPALGAFNQYVNGTRLEDWRNRHVDEIGLKLIRDASEIYRKAFSNQQTEEITSKINLEYTHSLA
ncbi:PfaD family protein [Sporocytophaga myxococcoides]|uniref:[acyl-carrier-protein] S-malonyltransferase n=1 Tax=Sporocytophaga myxococcoides TaxID=153721 RepID=A0A098L9U3_9BACT|nr:ACP S-malonyltransferase [Sporocytophaga myxococcoides]GAL83184.1 PfaD family protein [Sporocytophaga myxococcoides]